MKQNLILIFSILFLSAEASAQQKAKRPVDRFADFSVGIGRSQAAVSLAYVHNWKVLKRKKWEIGFGARFTSYFGSNHYFRTAPAKLTSGKTDPTVLFSDDIDANIDSVLFPKAQVNSFNISLNFGYNFSKKFSAGLNIDAVGFSFGGKQSGTYYGNNFATGVPVSAKPTVFNLLLISDNDKGSLNSELFGKYKWNNSWGVKLGIQFYFAEYKTDTKVQTTPGGDMNDRFRKKMLGAGIGVTYNFK
ncbi:MAG: hypothetical protein IPP96_17380 [Chitinophagaceae bacterium]|nr:hypothetical protein [Chitinophagaceae bacterium]